MTAERFTIETYTNRPDWLHGRKRGMGSSDSACAVGMGRWRGAYSVATDKLTAGIDDSPRDETAEWGHRHEPTISQKFAEVMEARGESFVMQDPGDFTIFRSIERPHVFCTPDRLLFDAFEVCDINRLVAELSIKCAFFEGAKNWAKTVPLEAQIQAQHTAYVLGVDTVYYAVLLNGCSFKWHLIRRNERWLSRILPRLDDFWESIQRGEYPNVDAAEETARALARRFPSPTAGHVELPADFAEMGDEYDKILADERLLEERKTLIANMAKEAIGNNTLGILPDGTAFSWKANGKGRRLTRIKKNVVTDA